MQEAPVLIECNFTLESDPVDTAEADTSEMKTSQADELINSANEKAALVIAQANATAEKLLHEAEGQVADIKQKAHEEGRLQGYQQGQQQGYEEGLLQGQQIGRSEWQTVIDQGIARTQEMLALVEQDAKEMIKSAERQIIDIALAVARKILAYEIAENPMVVLPLVKTALEKVSDQEEIVIRVSSDDFDSVLLAKRDLQNMVGREHALKIIPDRTIESGSCVIDTSYGTVDARVDTQFATIKTTLQGLVQ